jgi:hypothetical protein
MESDVQPDFPVKFAPLPNYFLRCHCQTYSTDGTVQPISISADAPPSHVKQPAEFLLEKAMLEQKDVMRTLEHYQLIDNIKLHNQQANYCLYYEPKI